MRRNSQAIATNRNDVRDKGLRAIGAIALITQKVNGINGVSAINLMESVH